LAYCESFVVHPYHHPYYYRFIAFVPETNNDWSSSHLDFIHGQTTSDHEKFNGGGEFWSRAVAGPDCRAISFE
jgi:hypothetical protein